MLAAGDTPDVVLLAWAGKSLPARLMPLHDDMLAALRLVRGLARAPAAQRDAALALAEALERAARGEDERAIAPEFLAIACASPPVAAMTAQLLQATRRELALALRGEAALFAGWSDFYSHARFSLVPVGRTLLGAADIAGETEAMDALMTAVALIALLQEAALRYRSAGTVSLPLQWLSGEGLSGIELGGRRSSASLRRAFARGTDRAYELLAIAGPTRGLRSIGDHASASNLLAHRLVRRLKRRDPLARPVALGLFDRLGLRLMRHA